MQVLQPRDLEPGSPCHVFRWDNVSEKQTIHLANQLVQSCSTQTPKCHQDSKSFTIWSHHPLQSLLLLLCHCVFCSSQAKPCAIPGTCISPTLPTILPKTGRFLHLTSLKPQLSLLSFIRFSLTSPRRGTPWYPWTGLILLTACSFFLSSQHAWFQLPV